MHPWLIYDTKKDDIKARYERADRHRLAAEIPSQRSRSPKSLVILLAGTGLTLASWVAGRAEAVRMALTRFAE